MNEQYDVMCPICGRVDKTERRMSPTTELHEMHWYWLETKDGVVAYCRDCADQVLGTYLMVHKLLQK